MAEESRTQTKIIKYLEDDGWMCNKTVKMARKGWPDIIAISPEGEHYWFEVKATYGRPSEIQHYVIGRMRDRNVNVHIVFSLDDVKRAIGAIDE